MTNIFCIRRSSILYRGGYGTVCRALDKQTEEYVALKRVDVRLGPSAVDKLRQEIQILQQFAGEAHIVGWRGAFCSARKVWIAMEVRVVYNIFPVRLTANCSVQLSAR